MQGCQCYCQQRSQQLLHSYHCSTLLLTIATTALTRRIQAVAASTLLQASQEVAEVILITLPPVLGLQHGQHRALLTRALV
jgi:hypothetical protein